MKYTKAEDMNMLKYLMQNGEYQRAKGVAVWRTMEKLQVLFAGQKRADIAACMLCVVPWRNCRYCLPFGSVWALQRACCVVYRGETAGTIYLSEACGRCNAVSYTHLTLPTMRRV